MFAQYFVAHTHRHARTHTNQANELEKRKTCSWKAFTFFFCIITQFEWDLSTHQIRTIMIIFLSYRPTMECISLHILNQWFAILFYFFSRWWAPFSFSVRFFCLVYRFRGDKRHTLLQFVDSTILVYGAPKNRWLNEKGVPFKSHFVCEQYD